MFIMLGADVNAVDNHGSTPLHVISECSTNATYQERISDDESEEEDGDEGHNTMTIELSDFHALDPPLAAELIRELVSNGGNIYAENSVGCTPLSLVRNPALKADMQFLTRRALLLFFEAVCIADDLACYDSLQRVAANFDLGRYIGGFL